MKGTMKKIIPWWFFASVAVSYATERELNSVAGLLLINAAASGVPHKAYKATEEEFDVAAATFAHHTISSKGIDASDIDLVASDDEIREKAKEIFKEAQRIFVLAHNRVDKLLNSSYQQDNLTFKDFVWALKHICSCMEQNVKRPLKALHSEVAGDSSLSKALSLIQSVASELTTGLNNLCKDLAPYEKTRDTSKAYTIAKNLKKNIEGFLTKDRFDRFKSHLDEVISILTKNCV